MRNSRADVVGVKNHDLMMSLLPQPIRDFFLFEAVGSFDPTPVFDQLDDPNLLARLRTLNRMETLKTYGKDHPCLKPTKNALRDFRK